MSSNVGIIKTCSVIEMHVLLPYNLYAWICRKERLRHRQRDAPPLKFFSYPYEGILYANV